MALLNRITRFARKSGPEKLDFLRFFSRQAISRLPFLPVRVRLEVLPAERIRFWWSYIPVNYHPNRSFLEYWGDDDGELRFVWQFLEPGMTFFDIGAHHGIFSLLASMKLGATGGVVAFEPSPRERRRFTLHMEMNGIRTIRLEPYAVSADKGALNFFTVESTYSAMNSLRRPRNEQRVREISVDAVSLDEYLRERHGSGPDLMKIDVEGGELAAFAGATGLLKSVRPVMICEVLDWVTEPWGYRAREIISRVQSYDYCWFDFAEDGKIVPHVPREEYPEVRNYLAVPREKLTLLEGRQRILAEGVSA